MDPAKMKVVDLRSELGALGLDTKGNKPALVERLKKALESKTGKVIADTTILDTSTEEGDDGPPRRASPAPRTRRRSSSIQATSTPTRTIRKESPIPIEEEIVEKNEPQVEEAVQIEEPPSEEPQPIQSVDDDSSQSAAEKESEPMEVQEVPPITEESDDSQQEQTEDKIQQDEKITDEKKTDESETDEMKVDENKSDDKKEDSDKEKEKEKKRRPRELTEEEEWEQLNERLQERAKEQLEKERLLAEEDAKKLEDASDNPVKFNRLKRKYERKARWANFYRTIEVTNEVLATFDESQMQNKLGKNGKEPPVETLKIPEPELNDNKITLSWYDSDLNQYLELPELQSVVPQSEGAFAHAWAGVRASHGVTGGRVCYEVRVGAVVSTTETEKDNQISGLRIGWSTDDSSLHLGEDELGWGYESSGRAVNAAQFKDYGKQLQEKDVVGVYLDLESNPCKISYTVNGVEIGTAFEFDKSILEDKALFPHVLTKNMCYKVNFGYDTYNMLTKTKIVRKSFQIPVEQVLAEKRAKEEELRQHKEEVARKEKERRERERKDREEKQRKKREEREKLEREKLEREKLEREKKAKEDQENVDQGEEAKEENKEDVEMVGPTETDEPKENGDQSSAEQKEESMETGAEASAEKPAAKGEVKDEPAEKEAVNITEDQVTLDPRIKFVIRHTMEEELDGIEADLLPGYVLISDAELVDGPRRPNSNAECEVILMVGMPGAGKTHWARNYVAANPEKRYNILSTGSLFDKMKVDCKPFRSIYEGRWDAMVSKCAKCVLRLLEIAQGRRRNFILDQTNVYPSAQRRKLREFEGYRRVAVVIVTDADTYADRQKRREETEGKEVPDGAILDMKANISLPEKCAWIDEVIYAELDEEEAKNIVEGFHKEAKAAGALKEKEKRERSASRDGPPNKRPRPDDRRHVRDDRRSRDFGREREDRWGGGGGGGGGGRWGPASRGGGGGSRWGPRDRPGPRFGDNRGGWGQPPPRGNDFGRDRDNFRVGRGGPPAGLGGDRGGPSPGNRGPPMSNRGPPPNDQGRFNRNERPPVSRPPGPPLGADKRPQGPPNQGSGTWQRGGQTGPSAVNQRGGPNQNRNPSGGVGGQPNNQVARANNAAVQKDNTPSNQNQQNQQGWNQWAASQWGNWGNWGNPQNAAGWGNWNNWSNWANQGNNPANNQGGNKQGQQQWTPQQWYQWQQWQQQQQQQWPGYQQQQQQGTPDQQAWAQYYQNYGGANTNTANNPTAGDKK